MYFCFDKLSTGRPDRQKTIGRKHSIPFAAPVFPALADVGETSLDARIEVLCFQLLLTVRIVIALSQCP